MSEQQAVSQEAKEEQDHQGNFKQSSEKLTQKNKSIYYKRTYFYKRVFVLSIVLIFLVSLIILFYKTQQPEKFADLFSRFKIVEQGGISSYEAFQRDKSINRDAKGEAGILMKSAVDKIFTCSGFAIETKSEITSVDREGNVGIVSNIVANGDVLPSSFDGHYLITGITGENIVVDKVTIDTPAQKAGIKKEDKIIAIDGVKINNRDELINYIQSKENLPVFLLIKRDGKEITLLIIPEKLYSERVGIGVRFVETNYRWSSESIYYGNDVYDKYNSLYLLGSGDGGDFDNPSLSEALQWSNPMHYLNYFRFYKNPEIIEETGSQIKIAFKVDISHFKPVDMNAFGKGSGMYNEIIEIEGEIAIDKHSQNPIQGKLKMILDAQGSLKLHRKTINVTLDFGDLDKGVTITPPDNEFIMVSW